MSNFHITIKRVKVNWGAIITQCDKSLRIGKFREWEQSLGVVKGPQIGGTGEKSPKRRLQDISLSHSKAGTPGSLKISSVMQVWLLTSLSLQW